MKNEILDKNEIKKIKKKEFDKFIKNWNENKEVRIIQMNLVQQLNLIKELPYKQDEYKIKVIESIEKQIKKIFHYAIEKHGDLNYYLSNKDCLEYSLDRLDGQLIIIQKENVIDIDTDEDKIIKDIFHYWKFCVHSHYNIKLINKFKKSINDIELKNMINGLMMQLAKVNKSMYLDLKSDKIFVEV